MALAAVNHQTTDRDSVFAAVAEFTRLYPDTKVEMRDRPDLVACTELHMIIAGIHLTHVRRIDRRTIDAKDPSFTFQLLKDMRHQILAHAKASMYGKSPAVDAGFAKQYADNVHELMAQKTSKLMSDKIDDIMLKAMEKSANPPFVIGFDPAAPVSDTHTVVKGRNHGKGLTFDKLKAVKDLFMANGADTFKFFNPEALQMWLDDAEPIKRPGTQFVGNAEDIFCVAGIPVMRKDKPSTPIPMGPWNLSKDDSVLGATTNSTDRGAEGDEFMGDVSRILTPEFRVSFPKVFKAEAFQEGQDPKYSLVMLFPKKMAPDMQKRFDAMKALAAATARAKWGDKMPKNIRSPFRDGTEKDLPGYEDVIFVSASSKVKPGLVNEDAEPMLNPEDFYPGCYAHAYVTCYAYDTAGNRGVAFGLSTVQKTKDGEPFAPRNNAQDDFAPVTPAVAAGTDDANGDIENLFGK